MIEDDAIESGPAAAPAQPGLDGLTERLDAMHALPLDEHAEAYQQIHAELQQALADIEAG